ncbi:MAG: FAD-dependent oxidoreductase [Proteobacteria bacterium]|nr:MAG: FAD-dependent oxidoreductase [Pseudomonadota bacterium]
MARIAIVGSGISGITSAYLLHNQGHEVTLIEAADRLGGHTATVEVKTESGTYAIDTGFIVFNDWTYPHFIKLLTDNGVKWKDTFMSFSVRSDRTGLEYNGRDLAHLFARKRNLFNLKFYRMLLEILRFNKESLELLDADESVTLGQYLKQKGYSAYFSEHYIYAMGAAIWSSNYDQMEDFPAKFFVQFFKNHGMLSVNDRPTWRVVEGGSKSYIEPLTRNFKERIELSSPVIGVSRQPQSVTLTIGGARPREKVFDYVVLAAHSHQSLKMLKDPSVEEQEILGAIHYQANDTILHTDESVLPNVHKTWAAWNYYLPREKNDTVALTYHMNILQGFESPESFLVSLNIRDRIKPECILKTYSYEHPVFTREAVIAQKRQLEISRKDRRTFFTGAYWGYGFHEDGVKSALHVSEALA